MLIIREAQKKAIAQVMLRRWIVDALRDAYPDRARALAFGVLTRHIDAALARAGARGHDSPDALWRYCHIDFLLGHGLETRPELAWAREVLDDPAIIVPGERLHALEQRVVRREEPACPPP